MYDVLVKNGRIVTADSVSEGNIAIRDGKIAAVLNAGEEPEACLTFIGIFLEAGLKPLCNGSFRQLPMLPF